MLHRRFCPYSQFSQERINAVVIDWGDGATPPNYVRAAGNTALVGRQIAAFLKHVKGIIEDPTVLSKVHLIGFSLGAQVAGFCGRYYRKLTQEVIDRITGKRTFSIPLFKCFLLLVFFLFLEAGSHTCCRPLQSAEYAAHFSPL